MSGKKAITAAREAGLSESSIPTLFVEGENRLGLGHAIARAIAEAGINVGFLVAQVIGTRFSAVMGFDDEAASHNAASLIEKVSRQIEK